MNTKKVICGSAGLFSIASAIAIYTNPILPVSADNVNFTVNVAESLAVSLTSPIDGSTTNTGGPGTFLRDSVLLSVFSNTSSGSAAGFTATMYEENSTNLTHTNNDYLKTVNGGTDVTVPTLTSSSARSSFPAGHWGYSLEGTVTGVDSVTYNETTAGNDSSNYYAMTTSASPITVLSSATAGSAERHIFFGAKPTASQPSGTYAGTVTINVVTGTIDETTNPVIPVDPAVNEDTSTTNPSYAYYSAPANRTVYTSRSTTPASGSEPATETTTTIVSSGDTRASYANPAGETNKTLASVNTDSGSPLAYGLAAAAGVAATSGILFLVLAKRDKDDEEEEQ